MHPEAYAYVEKLLAGQHLGGCAVCEIGAYTVNGSVRPLFAAAADYVGVDVRPGKGVDVVADGATWDGAGQRFDYVVSTETLEHTPDPAALVANAGRLLKTGGRLILTLATKDRAPHGVDGHPLRAGEVYSAITKAQVAEWLADWADVSIEHHPSRGDLYATATKAGRAKKAEATE